MHRSFSHPAVPVQNGGLHQISGSAQLLSHVENESDLQFQECHGQLEEYYRTLPGLSVLGRPCKYNIYKNIEGKADIPPFQCINSDVQK